MMDEMSNFPSWDKPPLQLFIECAAVYFLGRCWAVDLWWIIHSPVIQTVWGKTFLVSEMSDVWCLISESVLFFQEVVEVVEKNLRLTQDAVKKRDDAESVDNESTLSTSSNLEPFANDDLGTVTHVECI